MIRIQFGPSEDTIEFRWEIMDTPVARRWVETLREAIPSGIKEADRFYNFPGDGWTKETIAQEINVRIDLMKRVFPVHVRASAGMSQHDFNVLHHQFEIFRGSIGEPTIEWKNANPVERRALEDFNLLIHRWEGIDGGKPRIVCTFRDNKRSLLLDEEYECFSTTSQYGDILLNYCQVGKGLFDVFKDGDDLIHDDAIRPLRYMSADFKVRFVDVTPGQIAHVRKQFDPWLEKNRDHLERMGLHPTHPKLSLGNICVARMIDPPSEIDLVNLFRNRLHIHSIVID